MPHPARPRRPQQLLATAALAALSLSCAQPPSLLLITLQNIDAAATAVELTATLGEQTQTFPALTGADLANQGAGTTEVALKVAPEHLGALQLDVAVKKSRCVLQSTRATVNVGTTETSSSSIQLARPNVNACTLTVNVASVGGATGTVTSAPAQLSCPTTCVFSDTSVDTITLTANPSSGSSTQVTWNPAAGCSGLSCTIPISKLDLGGYSVTATFDGTPPNTDGCANVSFQAASLGVSGGSAGVYRAVWASSDQDVRVVGDNRYVRFDSARPGQPFSDTMPGLDLRAVYGIGASYVWMAGSQGQVALDDGSEFTQDTIGNGDDQFYGAWGDSFSDFFVVGSRFSFSTQVGLVVQYDGDAWYDLEFSAAPRTGPLRAIWGTDGCNVFAVGDGGAIVHRNKRTWSKIPALSAANNTSDLNGVFGNGTYIWAVGAGSTILRSSDGGFTWMPVPGPSAPATKLNAVWADSHRLIAVGGSGTIWCQNLNTGSPATWRVVSIGSAEMRGVFGTSTKVWVVGDNRTYLQSPL